MHVRTKLILGLAGALLVAACEDSDSSSNNNTGAGTELGNDFAAMFAASAMSDPVDAQSVSLPAVSKTTDPFNP